LSADGAAGIEPVDQIVAAVRQVKKEQREIRRRA
jgi:hypothetical protein